MPILVSAQGKYHIGIIRWSSIGDVVLSTACLQLLNALPETIAVSWVGRSSTIALLQAAYPQVSYIAIDREPSLSSTVNRLHGVQLLVDLQRNFGSLRITSLFKMRFWRPVAVIKKSSFSRSLLVWRALLQGRKTLGVPPSTGASKGRLHYQNMVGTLRQAILQHLSGLGRESAPGFACSPRPSLTPATLESLHHHLSLAYPTRALPGKWLAVAPGASYAPKQAPLTLVRDILGHVQRSFGARENPPGLLLLGDGNDAAVCAELQQSLSWPGLVLNLAGKLSLVECATVLAQASVLLCNDSGLGHLAEAVGTPTVVLFGPTVEAFGFAPHLAASRSFSEPLGCRPCSKHGKAVCRFGDNLCFTSISSDAVGEHLVQIIAPP